MAAATSIFRPELGKIRMGIQVCPGLPATDLSFHAQFVTEEANNQPGNIVPETLAASRARKRSLPGLSPSGGPINVEVNAEDYFLMLAQAMGGGSVVDSSPAFTWTLSDFETGVVWFGTLLTVETFRDDGIPQRMWDVAIGEVALNVEAGGLLTATFTLVAKAADYWGTPVLRNPGSAPAMVIGLDDHTEWVAKSGGLTIKATEVITPLLNENAATKVKVKRGPEQILSGTWTVSAGTNSFTGTSGAALTELRVGDYVDVEGQDDLEVATVPTNDSFTTVGNHTAGAAAVLVAEIFGPTETTLPRWTFSLTGAVQYGTLVDSRSGLELDDRGNKVQMRFDATGLTDPPVLNLTGTAEHSLGSDVLTGTGTAWLTELQVGQEIPLGDSISHRVATVTSDIAATTVRVRVAATDSSITIAMPIHWDVVQSRPDWIAVVSEAPIFNGISIEVTLDGRVIAAEQVGLTSTIPAVARPILGSRYHSTPRTNGLTTHVVSFNVETADDLIIKGSEHSAVFSLDIFARGKKFIATTTTEYSFRIICGNCTFTSFRETIPSGTERVQAVTANAEQDPANGTNPEDVKLVIVNTISEASATPPVV